MQIAFEISRFNPEVDKITTWAMKQKKRLIYLKVGKVGTKCIQRILLQCTSSIEHTVRSIIEITCDFDRRITIMEKIVFRAGIGKKKSTNKAIKQTSKLIKLNTKKNTRTYMSNTIAKRKDIQTIIVQNKRKDQQHQRRSCIK